MDEKTTVETNTELGTGHTLVVVVLGAIAGYVAGQAVSTGYKAGLGKVRAHRSASTTE